MIILYLILITFIFYQLFLLNDNSNLEAFESNTNEKNVNSKNIHSLMLSPYENNDKYFGLFVTNNKNKNIKNSNYIYSTNSLKSGVFKNNESIKKIKPSNMSPYIPNEILQDIFIDKYKKMIVIGLSFNLNTKKPLYSIYRNIYNNLNKENELNYKWEKLADKITIENNPMRSFCYDNKNGKLLGVSAYDGQIYEQKFNSDNYEEWIGPINFSKLRMRKIMYSKENLMIGIGLFDNYIYIKKNENWRTSEWNLDNINKTKVYDLIYDNDGCLIASTPNGIMKQNNQNFSSSFVLINELKQNNDIILENTEILKLKLGLVEDFEDDVFYINDKNLDKNMYSKIENLKKIYNIKKLTKDLCSNKKYLRKTQITKNNTKSDDFDNIISKNREINDLYSDIEELNNKLSK